MKLGAYEVAEELARGGMGVVLRGRAPDGREVALKVLLRPEARAGLARFERERRLLASLDEEHGFVRLLDAGDSPRGPYFVMPLMTGGTLRDRLQGGRLAIPDAVALVAQIARAMAFAHEKGVVHRDLKPENVLFTADGRALVADLGIAKHFDDAAPGASQSFALSQTGEARGTAGYGAPEQWLDAKTAGPPADVFSLGAILYECLTGRAAFAGETVFTVMDRIRAGDYEAPRALRADLSRDLEALLVRALAAEPGARFEDAGAFATALAAAKLEGGGARPRPALVGALLAVSLVPLWLLLAPRSATPPPGDPAPPPTPAIPSVAVAPTLVPEIARGFRSSKLTKLVAVRGRYEGAHAGQPTAVAIKADGTLALAGESSGRLVLWDLATGAAIRRLEGHEGAVTGVAFLGDSARAVSASEDGTFRVWDTTNGRPIGEPRRASSKLRSLGVTPLGGLAITGGDDGSVTVWDTNVGGSTDPLAVYTVHEAPVVAAAVSRKGQTAVTGSSDGTFIARDLVTLQTQTRQKGSSAVTAVAFGAADALAFVGRADGRVLVIDPERGRVPRELAAHGAAVVSLAVSADGAWLVTASADRTLKLWDVRDANAPPAVLEGHLAPVRAVAISRDGRRALSAALDGTVKLWDLPGRREAWPAGSRRGSVTALALSADGRKLLAGGVLPPVVSDLATGGTLRETERGPAWPAETTALAFEATPRGWCVLAGERDGSLATWDLEATAPPVVTRPHGSEVTAVAFVPRGGRTLSGEAYGPIVLAGPGGVERKLAGHPEAVRALACSADGACAVSGGADGSVRTWDLASGRELSRIEAHAKGVSAVAFTPDGRQVWSAGARDRALAAWDASTGALLDRIDLGASGDVATSLAFTADGRALVVGTARGVQLVFEVR